MPSSRVAQPTAEPVGGPEPRARPTRVPAAGALSPTPDEVSPLARLPLSLLCYSIPFSYSISFFNILAMTH